MTQPSTPPGPRGGRRIFFAALTILLALLAAALVDEIALRLAGYSPTNVNPLKAFHQFDPVLGWRGRKLYTARFQRPDFNVVIAHNVDGFRKQENLAPKADTAPHRVFVFGDSYVWGWGVAQGEVFTDRMNLLLRDYRVYNYGIDGIGTVVEYLAFAEFAKPKLRPGDVVVLTFCNNDFADNVDQKKIHAEAVEGEVRIVNPAKPLTTPLEDWFKDHSYLVNYLVYRADLYRLTRINRKLDDEVLGHAVAETDERYIVPKYFLAKFRSDCEAAKARFILVRIPTQEELAESRARRPNKRANETARAETLFAITRALGIGTLDLLPEFLARKQQTGETLTFKRDGHWNRTGHQAVAEILSKRISSGAQK